MSTPESIIRAGRSGVFYVQPGEAEAFATERSYQFFAIDASELLDKQSFIDALKEKLNFPEYFGNNWDAVVDMLRDLSWMPASGYVLLITGLERLQAENEEEYRIALDVLHDGAQFWAVRKHDKPPFIILIVVDEGPSVF